MNDLFINECIKEAKKSLETNDVPVGAIIVYNDKIIARAHNCREKNNIITGHAELRVLEKANKKLDTWRLDDCTLYITLEPCLMCYGAIVQSRIKKIYYLASNELYGFHNFINSNSNKSKFILCKNNAAIELLQNFFKNKRK